MFKYVVKRVIAAIITLWALVTIVFFLVRLMPGDLDLFGDSPYVDKYITNPPADYDVNPEYLNDEKFAALITEAEKYLGYPYVWGGSNPDTSFDRCV